MSSRLVWRTTYRVSVAVTHPTTIARSHYRSVVDPDPSTQEVS
jgi:hypothetical protein